MRCRTYHIVANPVAGVGDARALALCAARRLKACGRPVVEHITGGRGDATDIVARSVEEEDVLVVVGGDGTIREAVQGIFGRGIDIPVGIVPCGMSNIVVQGRGIPTNPNAAIDVLIDGGIEVSDLGVANGEVFLAVAGIGYEAATIGVVERLRRTRIGAAFYRHGFGKMLYMAGFIGAMRSQVRTELAVARDDRSLGGVIRSLLVFVTGVYGDSWRVMPAALATDGVLNDRLCRYGGIEGVGLSLLADVAEFSAAKEQFICGRGRSYSILCSSIFEWHLDGDAMVPVSNLSIDVGARQVQLLVPRSGSLNSRSNWSPLPLNWRASDGYELEESAEQRTNPKIHE